MADFSSGASTVPICSARSRMRLVSFPYFCVERPFYKFYGINCRPELGAKVLDRFFHQRRQVSAPVKNLTHRFLHGSQHFLDCNFSVGSRHRAVSPLLIRTAVLLDRSARFERCHDPTQTYRAALIGAAGPTNAGDV